MLTNKLSVTTLARMRMAIRSVPQIALRKLCLRSAHFVASPMPNSQEKTNRRATYRQGRGNASPLLVLVGRFRFTRSSTFGLLRVSLFRRYNVGLGNLEHCFHPPFKVLQRFRALDVFTLLHSRSVNLWPRKSRASCRQTTIHPKHSRRNQGSSARTQPTSPAKCVQV